MIEEGETKIGAGLCSTHANNNRCTATELARIVGLLFGIAGLS